MYRKCLISFLLLLFFSFNTTAQKVFYDTLYFDTDKYAIETRHLNVLQHFVRIAKKADAFYIEIYGHTDNVNTDEYNLALSQKRAETIETYFAGQFPDCYIHTAYFGLRNPSLPNKTAYGKAKNRRVEIKLWVSADSDIREADNSEIIPYIKPLAPAIPTGKISPVEIRKKRKKQSRKRTFHYPPFRYYPPCPKFSFWQKILMKSGIRSRKDCLLKMTQKKRRKQYRKYKRKYEAAKKRWEERNAQ